MSRFTVTLPVFFLAAISILFGCSSDNDKYPDGIYTNFRYDLVTFCGITGNQASFSYVPRSDDSATVTLTAQKGFSTDGLTAGKRVLLRYSPQPGTAVSDTQSIYAYFYNSIISDTLRAYRSDVPVSSFSMHPVKMRSAWRTGNYINLHCQVEYTGKARVFMLVSFTQVMGGAMPPMPTPCIATSSTTSAPTPPIFGATAMRLSLWAGSGTSRHAALYAYTSTMQPIRKKTASTSPNNLLFLLTC